jgi:cytoskeletal protein CcmA (bactofilin family)
MFSKDSKPEKFKDAETIIGPTLKVKGNFQGSGDIVVDGILDGSIKTDADIFVGEKAKITATIESQEAIINGHVQGSIKVKKYLAIGSTAKITGDVQCEEISVEKGAVINGQLLVNVGKEDIGIKKPELKKPEKQE